MKKFLVVLFIPYCLISCAPTRESIHEIHPSWSLDVCEVVASGMASPGPKLTSEQFDCAFGVLLKSWKWGQHIHYSQMPRTTMRPESDYWGIRFAAYRCR